MTNLCKELGNALFEEKNKNKAIRIAKNIDNEIRKNDSKFARWERKRQTLKCLGFDLKYPFYIPSIRKCVEIIYYFCNELGLKIDDFNKMLEKQPALLRYSSKNYIEPKVKYLQKIGFSLDEIREYIKNNPTILTYSTPRFILRIEYAISKGHEIKSLSDVFSLLYPSDKKFIEKLKELGFNTSLEEYSRFRKEIATLIF
ncbi:MAG: hypothetical protein QXP34_00530 [Candidatus Aenigmatarchaeota archaeon]